MDLKQFIAETLVQLVEGVQEAQIRAVESGAKVNPELYGNVNELAKFGVIISPTKGATTMVEFDVALTVTEGTGTRGGIGVFAGAVNLGSSGQSKTENVSVSHVRFRVPVALPYKA